MISYSVFILLQSADHTLLEHVRNLLIGVLALNVSGEWNSLGQQCAYIFEFLDSN